MENGYYSSDMIRALGIANLRAGVKMINESFSMKLLKLEDGKRVFVPIIDVLNFVKYLGEKRVITVRVQGGKNGIVFSIPKEFRPKLDSASKLRIKYGIEI